ncbi:MAG: TRAP transporter small permease subunit, partial [Desulfatiglandales bacterium]
MKKLSSLIRKCNYYTCMMGMFSIIPLMLLTTSDVLMRAIFNKPIKGTFELSEYLLSISILLGAAYTQQVKGHVGVNFVIVRLGKRKRAFVESITNMGSLFVLIIISWQGLLRAFEETTVSDMLRIPQWPFRFLVFVAGVGLSLELLLDFKDSLRDLF